MKILFYCLLFPFFIQGQQSADTLIIGGNIIFFTSKIDLFKKNIDKTYNFYFVPSDEKQVKKVNYERLNSADKNRDSIFLICNGGSFVTFNELFLQNKIKPVIYNTELYPKKKSYTSKDKKFVYKVSYIQAKCLQYKMTRKDLLNIIPTEQYNFKNDTIKLYLIVKIIK